MTSLNIHPLLGRPAEAVRPARIDVEEAAYREIVTAILEQRLRPGTKLGERWLAETFNISRARVRRILLRLVQDQVVTQHPHRGAFVASPTLAEARDLMQVRRALEAKVVTMASTSITSRDIRELAALIENEVAVRHQGDMATALSVGAEFHLKLAEIAGNQVLYDIVRDLVARSSLMIAQSQKTTCAICPADDHPGILKAIQVGETDRAVTVMDEHLRNVERTLWSHDDGAQGMVAGGRRNL